MYVCDSCHSCLQAGSWDSVTQDYAGDPKGAERFMSLVEANLEQACPRNDELTHRGECHVGSCYFTCEACWHTEVSPAEVWLPSRVYSLILTEDEVKTFDSVGSRYGWSSSLNVEVGLNQISEHEAWEWKDAVEADMEGGHSIFPLLAGDSDLRAKLMALHEQIV